MPKTSHLRVFVSRLIREELYDDDEESWCFKSGGHCGDCTVSALKIARRFNGAVFGYDSGDNPTALIGKQTGWDGHDFALIAERYLVDYWAFRYAELSDHPVLDLCDPQDQLLVKKLYGPQDRWCAVPQPIEKPA